MAFEKSKKLWPSKSHFFSNFFFLDKNTSKSEILVSMVRTDCEKFPFMSVYVQFFLFIKLASSKKSFFDFDRFLNFYLILSKTTMPILTCWV